MIEIWKDIKGYENLYQVSNLGRIKSFVQTPKGKILKHGKDGKGYPFVILCNSNNRTAIKIHRIVATHFIPNPHDLPQVNHINEDKTDNRVENLEWCTNEYNRNYGTRNERAKQSIGKGKNNKRSIPIIQFTLNNDFIKIWDSATVAATELNISRSHIPSCCTGKRQYANGYKWGYADEYERIPFKVFDLTFYRKKVI